MRGHVLTNMDFINNARSLQRHRVLVLYSTIPGRMIFGVIVRDYLTNYRALEVACMDACMSKLM